MAGSLSYRQFYILFHFLIIVSVSNANQDSEGDVKVPLGMDVTLVCSLADKSLSLPDAPHEMSWIRSGAVLSSNYKMMSNDSRLNVSTYNLTYLLHISQVKESDRGCYYCEVTSTTVTTKMYCIDVLVSPDIIETSVDVTVDEGQDTTLICKAGGRPEPSIHWRREDNHPISYEANRMMLIAQQVSGPVLRLVDVRRSQSGAFFCTAANNVPPTVTKRIYLTVNYIPKAKVEKAMVGGEEGRGVRLVCTCSAFPIPQLIWSFNDVHITHSHKFILDKEVAYDVVKLGLRLRSVSSEDFGFYTCICNNTMGRDVSSLELYRINSTSSDPTNVSLEKDPVRHIGYSNEDDIAAEETDDNSLGSMTSAKATSIRISVLDSFLGHAVHQKHDASSSTRIIASFLYILIFSILMF